MQKIIELTSLFKEIFSNHLNLFLYTFLFVVLWDTRGISFDSTSIPWSSVFLIAILIMAIKDYFSPNSNSIISNIRYLNFVLGLQFLLFIIGFIVPDRELFMFTKVLQYKFIYQTILLISIVASTFYIINEDKTLFKILIILFIFLLISSIYVSVDTATDTHTFLQIASDYFLSLKNPYSYTYPDLYNGKYDSIYGKTFYFNYWPTCLFFTSIFKKILGDVRYAFVFFHIIAALLLLKTSISKISKFICLIWFSNMIAISTSERSLIDGIVPGLLLLAVFFYSKNKILLSGFLFGLIGSVKLYYIFLLPFFAIYFYQKKHYKAILFILIGFVMPILPFIFISPNEFYLSTIKFISQTKIRIDSISLISALKRVYSIDFSKFGTMTTLIYLAFVYLYIIIKKHSIIDVLKIINISFLVIFLLGKQAFCNYFYFNMFLFLLIYTLQNQENKLNYE